MSELHPETFDLDKFQRDVLQGIDSIEEEAPPLDVYNMIERRHAVVALESSKDFSEIRQRQKVLEEIRQEIYGKILIFNTGKLDKLLNELEKLEQEFYKAIQQKLQSIQHQIEQEIGEVYYGYSSAIRENTQNRKEQEEQQVIATKALIKEKILIHICPALQSISGDSHDIAKIIVPILVPLVLAGTLTIPLQPLIFSYIAILISRMGIASLCAGYSNKAGSKES